MSFHEVQFPPNISYGSRGGPGLNTAIISTDAGSEQRIARWSEARHQYDIGWGLKKRVDMATVLNFWHARRGALYGFRYKDWHDYTSNANHQGAVAATDCPIGVGDGTNKTFQLQKKYVSGGTTHYRVITKPVSGTVLVALDGTPTTDFSVDTTTGRVTLTTAPGLGVVVTAGFQFDVPVRFDESADQLIQASIDELDASSFQGITLVEIKDSTPTDPLGLFYGGACEQSISGDVTLALGLGRVHAISSKSDTYKVRLPDPTNLPTGGPLFYVANAGSHNFDVTDHTGATVFSTLTPGAMCEALLTVDGSGTKHWIVA